MSQPELIDLNWTSSPPNLITTPTSSQTAKSNNDSQEILDNMVLLSSGQLVDLMDPKFMNNFLSQNSQQQQQTSSSQQLIIKSELQDGPNIETTTNQNNSTDLNNNKFISNGPLKDYFNHDLNHDQINNNNHSKPPSSSSTSTTTSKYTVLKKRCIEEWNGRIAEQDKTAKQFQLENYLLQLKTEPPNETLKHNDNDHLIKLSINNFQRFRKSSAGSSNKSSSNGFDSDSSEGTTGTKSVVSKSSNDDEFDFSIVPEYSEDSQSVDSRMFSSKHQNDLDEEFQFQPTTNQSTKTKTTKSKKDDFCEPIGYQQMNRRERNRLAAQRLREKRKKEKLELDQNLEFENIKKRQLEEQVKILSNEIEKYRKLTNLKFKD